MNNTVRNRHTHQRFSPSSSSTNQRHGGQLHALCRPAPAYAACRPLPRGQHDCRASASHGTQPAGDSRGHQPVRPHYQRQGPKAGLGTLRRAHRLLHLWHGLGYGDWQVLAACA